MNLFKQQNTQINETVKIKKYFNDIAMYFNNIQLIMTYTAIVSIAFFFIFIYFFGDNIARNIEIGTNTWNALTGALQFKEIGFITAEGVYKISAWKALNILSTDLLNILLNSLIFSVVFFVVITIISYMFIAKRSEEKNKDLHKDKVKRGASLLENEEYIEFIKEHKQEEINSNERDYIELSNVYKVEEFKSTDKKEIATIYNRELKEMKKSHSKILLKQANFIKDATAEDLRFFKFEEAGKLKLHYKDCFQHLEVSGSSGSGKSNFLTNYISQLLKRFSYFDYDQNIRKKKKLVILDLGEEFTTKFYNEKDWIKVNPFSLDGYYINDFDYIQNELQISSMAEIRIQEEKGNNSQYFTSIKRSYLKAAYAYCLVKDKKENKYVYELLSRSKDDLTEELKKTIEKTLSVIQKIEQKLLIKSLDSFDRKFLSTEKTKLISLINFMKTAKELISEGQQAQTNYMSLVEMLSNLTFLKLECNNLNLRDWIANDHRNLIVSVPLKTKAQSMSVASVFFDILGRELLNIGENFGVDEDREIHLIIDEFTNISKIQVIIELLTLVRKYNVSVVLSYQEISRISLMFSKEELEAFQNNIATKIIFQSSGEETTKNIQSKVGKQDLEYSLMSNNLGIDNSKDGANVNKQIQEKSVITEAEIVALKPFQFLYVRKGNSLKNDENKTIFVSAKIQSCIDLSTLKEKREDQYSEIKDSLKLVDLNKLIEILEDSDDTEREEAEARKRELLEKVMKKAEKKEEIIKEEVKKEDDLAYLNDYLLDVKVEEIELIPDLDLDEKENPYN